ncbi:DUF6364 family protein [Membranihabitans maritimus]|uniref:DUF6364 family protein n=1 Tax=Membranihabitans maritimus TaxID=2904244 RepID=UPI0034E1F8F8
MDKELVERSKKYAKETGRSLSHILASYLENVTKSQIDIGIPRKLQLLIGAINLPEDFDEEKEKAEYLSKKYV